MVSYGCEQTFQREFGQQTLLIGLVLGVAADVLMWSDAWAGPGLSLWLLLLGAGALTLNYTSSDLWRASLSLWFCVAICASLILLVRSTPVLPALVFLVIITCAVMVLSQARGTSLKEASMGTFLRSFWRLPLQVLPGSLPLLRHVQWQGLTRSTRLWGILKGGIFAAPLLLLFVALFSSADAQFDDLISRITATFTFSAPRHLLIIAGFTWLATGLLSCTKPLSIPPAVPRCRYSLGGEETAVIMGSLVILFSVFVVLQASYLFGGQSVIESNSGLTVAMYARRGFFELFAVASLTLIVLLSLSAMQCPARIFRPLAYALVVCVLVILASAIQRLVLYVEAFGLSMSRLLAFAGMLYLAGNLLSFAGTCLRGRPEGFASGLVISGIVTIFIFSFVNPAAVVTKVNISRAQKNTAEIDWPYLMTLGPDAVPHLLRNLSAVPYPAQCHLANQLLQRYTKTVGARGSQWRTWNWSEEVAYKAVEEAYVSLFQLSGRAQMMSERGPLYPSLYPLCGSAPVL